MAIMNCPNCGGKISDAANKCIHCGYQLVNDDGGQSPTTSSSSLTCPECGRTVSATDTNCPDCGFPLKQKKNNTGKILGIVGGAAVLMALIVLLVFFIGNSRPVDKYIKALEAGNLDKAADTYENKIQGKSELETELESDIKRLADETYEQYLNEKSTEEQAKDEIKALCESKGKL